MIYIVDGCAGLRYFSYALNTKKEELSILIIDVSYTIAQLEMT